MPGQRRSLPSCPTRRSSDLEGIGAAAAQAIGRVSAPPIPAAGRRSCRSHAGEFDNSAAPLPGWVARRLDRKSTRLNSSHRCTSYAVFCLKKKNGKKLKKADE